MRTVRSLSKKSLTLSANARWRGRQRALSLLRRGFAVIFFFEFYYPSTTLKLFTTMAIHYDFYSAENLKNVTGELIARPIVQQTCSLDRLMKRIEEYTAATEGDVALVISALKHEIVHELLQGNNVCIDGLGTFSIAMKGDIERNSLNRLVLKNAAVKSVRFIPSTELMGKLSGASFARAQHRGHHSSKVSDDEVRNAAMELTEGGKVFTSKEFRSHLGLAATSARKHLLKLQEEGIIYNKGGRRYALFSRTDTSATE